MDFKTLDYKSFGAGFFPEFIGVEIIHVNTNAATARMEIKKNHFAPNGYLHAGSIVTLADTIAGYGCLYNLPESGISFTTIELKTNFLGAIKSGSIIAEAVLQHAGKTTQVWDVTVKNEVSNKTIALFRCTQLILYAQK
ncbi:MAG TPA: PaaI family thioesterase [Saprospiraceae bacterium]|nr:PaaI family thioesterase [Saprospiraceae bacterium]